jgi:hypothetical protein
LGELKRRRDDDDINYQLYANVRRERGIQQLDMKENRDCESKKNEYVRNRLLKMKMGSDFFFLLQFINTLSLPLSKSILQHGKTTY